MILNIAARSKGKGKVKFMSGQVVRSAGWSLLRFRSIICIYISPVLRGVTPAFSCWYIFEYLGGEKHYRVCVLLRNPKQWSWSPELEPGALDPSARSPLCHCASRKAGGSWNNWGYITIIPWARVGYNHFISNKGEWNNCFSKFSNRVLPPIFISTILQSVRKENF